MKSKFREFRKCNIQSCINRQSPLMIGPLSFNEDFLKFDVSKRSILSCNLEKIYLEFKQAFLGNIFLNNHQMENIPKST
ncbi:hypothetical protein BpHYR1_016533 [Brachionus plicatilis]|uniref:Uncharacterized protein n=1 Tax=Brachionus plicatilis TaxID=10195 RepID=A0A3M7R7D5_BRAPC|nr:hypothetical protein BpHYR1_016533 [Brachionus plicatilis]